MRPASTPAGRTSLGPPLLAALLVAGCAATTFTGGRACESGGLRVDGRFAGGGFARCSFTAGDAVEIVVEPEDAPPINPSPWYAFRLRSRRPGEITVRLRFAHGQARYWPKLSEDRRRWRSAEKSRVRVADDRRSLELELATGRAPLWVAAQELVTAASYDRWVGRLAARAGVQARRLGRSVRGRPIRALVTRSRPEVVVLLGRQHPPEVSGALALRGFAEAVLGPGPLARRFRQRYQVVVVPLLNPDGVALGHWRHNAGGVDLNRDWGPFTQPETRGVARLLDRLEAAGSRPRLMLDFHSTRSTLFYTQLPEDGTRPPGFATRWLGAVGARLPGFAFAHEPRPSSERANAKNYFFRRYGIPAITVELGDEADRAEIARAAPVLAEEMMRLLLGFRPGPPAGGRLPTRRDGDSRRSRG